MRRHLTISMASLIASAVVVSGCATASFSPPSTNLVNVMEARGSSRSLTKSCQPYEQTTIIKQTGKKDKKVPIKIGRSAEDAILLADNFIYEYRCASHSAGNSRQVFEVPGLLTGIGTATALALGAGSDVAIAGGSATALFDGGKDYYAPLGKAAIYDSALDAQLCIKSAALGIKPFSTSADDKLGVSEAERESAEGSYFSAERQFFGLVSTALLNVERIAASRLRSSAKYDPAGIVAQIEKLAEEAKEKKDKLKKLSDDPESTEEHKSALAMVETNDTTKNKSTTEKKAIATTVAEGLTQNDLLHTKLQQCVLRAQI